MARSSRHREPASWHAPASRTAGHCKAITSQASPDLPCAALRLALGTDADAQHTCKQPQTPRGHQHMCPPPPEALCSYINIRNQLHQPICSTVCPILMPTHLSSSSSHAHQPPVMRKRRPAPKPTMLRRTLASLLATTILPLATCQFTSPAAGAVLAAGTKVNVSYTTDLKNYTIALWQRAEEGGRPRLGSIVYGEFATRLDSTRPRAPSE